MLDPSSRSHRASEPPDLPLVGDRAASTALIASGLSARLQPIAQPDGTAWQHLAAFERHRGDRSWRIRVVIGRIEDARGAFRAMHPRIDGEADLIDQPGAQKAAVGDAAAIDLEPLDAELPVRASSAKARSN